MKEYPTVYVINSYSDGVCGAYYQEADAVKWMNKQIPTWHPNTKWSDIYELVKVKVY